MGTFENHLDNVNGARIVSWPFRVLATFLVAACIFAWGGSVYQGLANGRPNGILHAVLLLPLVGFSLVRVDTRCYQVESCATPCGHLPQEP